MLDIILIVLDFIKLWLFVMIRLVSKCFSYLMIIGLFCQVILIFTSGRFGERLMILISGGALILISLRLEVWADTKIKNNYLNNE